MKNGCKGQALDSGMFLPSMDGRDSRRQKRTRLRVVRVENVAV